MKLSNFVWNLAGLATPLVVAALTIPSLIKLIGMERFGLLALAWGLIGYAGVFDLGIGRAATQLIAQLRGQNAYSSIPVVISSATRLTLQSGTVGLFLMSLAAICGVQRLIHHSIGLENEITASVFILALIIPVQAISATYRGVNEAFENFRGISLLRMMLGAFNFLGPYLVAQVTSNLSLLVLTLLISRLVALIGFRYLALQYGRYHCSVKINEFVDIDQAQIKKKLFKFGGWFTLSSIIVPLMGQADRFFISSSISASAVSSYIVPSEIVLQSLVVVGALTTVLFPTFSSQLAFGNKDQALQVFYKWLKMSFIMMTLIAVALALLLPVILAGWLGNVLPKESVVVGRVLCVGLPFYTIGTMYVALLHSLGRSDLTAKANLIETPFFLIAMVYLIGKYGVIGASIAWVVRISVDALILYVLFTRLHWSPKIYKGSLSDSRDVLGKSSV